LFSAVQSCLKSVASVVALGVALAACGGDEPAREAPARPSESPPATSAATNAATTGDPPTEFSTDLPLGTTASWADAAVVSGHTAVWINREGLGGTDVATGRELWQLPVEGHDSLADKIAGPLVDPASDDPVVYAVVAREVKGTGTVADKSVLLVLAVDAESGEKRWERPIDAGRNSLSVEKPSLVVGEGLVAVTNSSGIEPVTYALEAATGEVRWQEKNLDVAAVGKGVVAGVRYSRTSLDAEIVGLDAADGSRTWRWKPPKGTQFATSGPSGDALPLGPDLLFVPVRPDADQFSGVVDVATGRTRLSAGDDSLNECVHDQEDTVICSGFERTAAFDAGTMQELWRLPAGDRTYLKVTAAFHGAVYGETRDGRAVVLDARTGADRPSKLGLAPTFVNEYAALGEGDGDQLSAFKAIG
jgi:outer membrane protein assembly factor BamB